MKIWILALLLCCSCATKAALADEELAKQKFIACTRAKDLAACDELIAMPNLSDTSRSDAFAARSIARATIGDILGADSDASESLHLNPANGVALRVKSLLAEIPKDATSTLDSECAYGTDADRRLKACGELIALSAGDPATQARMLDVRAGIYMNTNLLREAIGDLERARRLSPEEETFAEHMMIAKFWYGDYRGALKANGDAFSLLGARPNGQLHYYRGSLLYLIGDLTQSEAEFEKAASMGSEYSVAAYWAAVIRTEQGTDATATYQSLADDPLSGGFANSLARLRLGKETASDVLEHASLLTGPEGLDALCMAHFHIGHQAWLKGDMRQARDHFTAALVGERQRNLEYQAAKVLLTKL
jgi:tetratricopeptide (TPR) repeat protein